MYTSRQGKNRRNCVFSYFDLEMKTRGQNRNNKRTEIERIDWFIERIQTRLAFGWLVKGQHSEAQGIVNEVVNWSIRNRVKLNTDKCKELRISFTSDCDFPPVVIGEECIKLVKDAKLLGVTISGDLTWNAHITEVTKKAAKRLFFFCSAKKSSCSTERFMTFLHYMRALRH